MTALRSLRRSSAVFAALVGAALGQAPGAAEPAAAAAQRHVAAAIRAWVHDFERGRLGPGGLLREGRDLQPAYVAAAREAGLVRPADADRLTHLDVLQRLLFTAERAPSPELAEAVLGLAAIGFDTRFLDADALQLRELGHWSLLRFDHAGAWFLLLRAAAGQRVPWPGQREEAAAPGQDGLVVGPARRVAALRLLAQKDLPVAAGTLRLALRDPDPRVRLCMAELFEQQRAASHLPALLQALPAERHPVVAQALVRALGAVLRAHRGQLPEGQGAAAVEAAIDHVGEAGWRTDMEILDLVEAFPTKAAVPVLIECLERADRRRDALETVVNRRATPRLRERAHGLLRGLTGALLPADDPAGWRQFWQQEQHRIAVPPQLVRERPDATRAQFFGVPVTGSAIAFVIDTSGSMDDAVGGTAAPGGKPGRGLTRLRAAKEQLAQCVQAMDPQSTYVVITFASGARVWTPSPVKPSSSSNRSLTELLSRLRAHGGTNLYAGLAEALQLGQLGYAEQDQVRVDEVFVLSDGEPTAGEVQDPERLLQLVREANKYAKVRIHAVFTGSGDGAALLRQLAEQNDGVFVQR